MNLNKIPPQIKVYGDTAFRGDCPKETPEQISFLCLLKSEFPEFAKIAVHIKNEGKRNQAPRSPPKTGRLSYRSERHCHTLLPTNAN